MEWATLALAVGGPLLVACVVGVAQWAIRRAREIEELEGRVSDIEDRAESASSGVRQLREDLRELRRYVFTRNSNRDRR